MAIRSLRSAKGRRLAAMAAALAFVPAVAASSGAQAPRQPADELARAVDAYDRATVSNDTETLSALVADDYMLVNSDASVQDKASYLADFDVPGFEIDPYRIEHPIRRVHADAALTGGQLHLRWTQDGRTQGRRLRVAHFWVRREGRWRLAYTQLTRIPEAAP